MIGVGAEANFGNDFVRIGGVKGFMDGSLGSSTAKMFEPYEASRTTPASSSPSRTRCA